MNLGRVSRCPAGLLGTKVNLIHFELEWSSVECRVQGWQKQEQVFLLPVAPRIIVFSGVLEHTISKE